MASRRPTTWRRSSLHTGSAQARTSLVLDKATPGAGASGIACGVVRNNYFQPAMSELMQACVEVWESDPEAYAYNSVGYIALGAAVQESDLTATFERQERIGYRSELIVGEAEVDAHMKVLFPDWRAQGVTICLHEHQGGFAFNVESVLGLRDKCLSEGVTILSQHRGHRIPLGPDDTGCRCRDERRRDRGRRAGGHRAGTVGEPVLGDARAPADDRHHDAVRARSSTTAPCGRTGICRKARSRSTR